MAASEVQRPCARLRRHGEAKQSPKRLGPPNVERDVLPVCVRRVRASTGLVLSVGKSCTCGLRLADLVPSSVKEMTNVRRRWRSLRSLCGGGTGSTGDFLLSKPIQRRQRFQHRTVAGNGRRNRGLQIFPAGIRSERAAPTAARTRRISCSTARLASQSERGCHWNSQARLISRAGRPQRDRANPGETRQIRRPSCATVFHTPEPR
ncbi:hypothetical protein P3T23_003253 [Paraburkholderia sp. GAS448]